MEEPVNAEDVIKLEFSDSGTAEELGAFRLSGEGNAIELPDDTRGVCGVLGGGSVKGRALGVDISPSSPSSIRSYTSSILAEGSRGNDL